MRCEGLLAEPGPDLADCLEFFGVGIVTGKQEGAVEVGPFAFAVVAAYYDEVERVADAGQVVLLELYVYESET